MKVFISWSGEPSKTVARALRDWLPYVVPQCDPWVSDVDIAAGKRWGHELANELIDTKYGIICITKDNQLKPWIMFEAGALAKTLQDTPVCPYLIDLKSTEWLPSPLTQFQAKQANKEDTFALVSGINTALKDGNVLESRLQVTFEKFWPDLESTLNNLPSDLTPVQPSRSVEDMTEEILLLVRQIGVYQASNALMPSGGAAATFTPTIFTAPRFTPVVLSPTYTVLGGLGPALHKEWQEKIQAAATDEETSEDTDSPELNNA
jgi:hypothetical protein